MESSHRGAMQRFAAVIQKKCNTRSCCDFVQLFASAEGIQIDLEGSKKPVFVSDTKIGTFGQVDPIDVRCNKYGRKITPDTKSAN
ncbi:hypothetical protein SH661x_003140 [Planctomicrobium sp. SH661]|uniref:hypothetical protein n=1 Tax=Planctomicrobium sp. SH661 TaxID=3448124 RepID=UPI003F5CB64D